VPDTEPARENDAVPLLVATDRRELLPHFGVLVSLVGVSGVRFVPVHGTERRSGGCQRAAPAMNVATM
jgi:hypothetical protein